jgi:hypothetical protein
MNRLLRPERLVLMVVLAVAVGVVLLLPDGRVFGSALGDLPTQFIPWRAFATASLRGGHLPLWNPYTYAGEPFLGGFQSAVLYPLNAVFLCLPLARAINLSILLHLVILGWGGYRWAVRRGLHPGAGIACGATLVLSGAVYPHVYAGHLSNICTMAWAPWILGGLESWWSARRLSGLAEASAAICLQILAGHVQYVFMTGIAAGVMALVASAAEPAVRRRALPAVAGCYAAAALLAAAQLFPGLAAVGEGLRQGKLLFAYASIFSFPPENFLTLFAPGFFGDHLHDPYWGRWYIQEMSVFIGAAGTVLVLIGAFDPVRRRRARLDLAVGGLLVLLALGANTPVYRLLYEFVPGFGQIRGMSKFNFLATIFVVLALGSGVDALIRGRPVRRGLAGLALAAGAALAIGGGFLLGQPESVGGWMRAWLAASQDYLPPAALTEPGFVHGAGIRAARSLLAAAALFLLLGGSLALRGRRAWLRWVPLAVLGGEMLAFAWTNSASCDAAIPTPDGAREFLGQHPGDYRVLTLVLPSGFDGGFLLGAPDLWGNDPSVLQRYAEFMTFTQNLDPNRASQSLVFKGGSKLYALLRLQYIFALLADGRVGAYPAAAPPLDHAQLVSDYRVLPGRDAIFAAMSRPEFDPRRTVLLESEPSPRPVPSDSPGTVHLVATSPDTLVIAAEVTSPALLLVTDPYSRDWRAVPLAGSSQQSYQVLPADYVVRAVPLARGHHLLLMEYVVPSFRIGLAVSLVAWLGWIAAAIAARRRRAAAGP